MLRARDRAGAQRVQPRADVWQCCPRRRCKMGCQLNLGCLAHSFFFCGLWVPQSLYLGALELAFDAPFSHPVFECIFAAFPCWVNRPIGLARTWGILAI